MSNSYQVSQCGEVGRLKVYIFLKGSVRRIRIVKLRQIESKNRAMAGKREGLAHSKGHIFKAQVFSIQISQIATWKTKMTGRPDQTRPLTWTNMGLSWEKICKLIFFQILFGIWWHWVSRGHYLLVLGGNGSVLGSTDYNTWLYLVGRGQ